MRTDLHKELVLCKVVVTVRVQFLRYTQQIATSNDSYILYSPTDLAISSGHRNCDHIIKRGKLLCHLMSQHYY